MMYNGIADNTVPYEGGSEVVDGVKARLSLEVASGGGGMSLRAKAGELSLANFAAGPVAEPAKTPVSLSALSIGGAQFDSGEGTLSIDTAKLGKLHVDSAIQNQRLSLR